MCVILYRSDGDFSLSGPKGVINDWRKFKQLEVEQKQEQKREMERLIKKLSMTCRSDLDLEKDKEKEKELQDKIKGKVSRMKTDYIHGKLLVPHSVLELLLWEKAQYRQGIN